MKNLFLPFAVIETPSPSGNSFKFEKSDTFIKPLYDNGQELFSNVKEQSLEGIVQYNGSAPYYLNSRPKDVITIG